MEVSVSSVEICSPQKKRQGCLLQLLVDVMGFKQVQLKGMFLYPVTLKMQFFAISRSIFFWGFNSNLYMQRISLYNPLNGDTYCFVGHTSRRGRKFLGPELSLKGSVRTFQKQVFFSP